APRGPAGGPRARVLRRTVADRDRGVHQAAAGDGEDAHPDWPRTPPHPGEAPGMTHDETFDSLVAVYAVGALDGEELVRLEAHLAEGGAACETALRESSETFAALAREVPRAIPPPHVKEVLLRRIAEAAPTAPRARPGSSRLRWLGGAAAAVIIVSVFTAGF